MVTNQLQVERRTGKVRRPETDVLPLCHATVHMTYRLLYMIKFVRHKGSASTIQSIYMLENKRPQIKKSYKEKNTVKYTQ